MAAHVENYYEILSLTQQASHEEIARAYHTAKSTFSKDNLATYTLFTPEEKQQELARLEEAYQHLSNPERRRQYDKRLTLIQGGLSEESLPQEPLDLLIPSSQKESVSFDLKAGDPLTGELLKRIRERQALTLEDVSRITKISVRSLTAIEEEKKDQVPARVYLQGFIRNLAQLYHLDPKVAVSAYCKHIDGE